jgi:hypothetical protein
MSWQEYRARAKIIEQNFAKNLKDPTWANDYQDMQEHWDVKGTLDNELLKFDVKGMKKVNRWDNKKQDDIIFQTTNRVATTRIFSRLIKV